MNFLGYGDQRQAVLWQELARFGCVLGPVVAANGVVRLRPLAGWQELAPAERLPSLSLKALLMPLDEELWAETADGWCAPPEADPTVVVGMASCDLEALAWLDLQLIDDAPYQRRRRQLRVVGRPCQASPSCHCTPRPGPPVFDLFLDAAGIWSGSPWGDTVLAAIAPDGISTRNDGPDTGDFGSAPPLPGDLEDRFAASAGAPFWAETAARCLSCGACSAVCPTCTCFDMVDVAFPGAPVRRLRRWDNCFFREHALVAGGHNFRPDRTTRLRFRFEHKMLGFGQLRGRSSCVGCGRCAAACPARIDLQPLLAELRGMSMGGG